MDAAQMGLDEPVSICEGLVALRFMSWESWVSKSTKHSGYKVKLEDGGLIFIGHPHLLLRLRDQLEVRYKVLLWSAGYCLEHPEKLLNFTVDSRTPVIIKREIRMSDGMIAWSYQIAKCSI